MVSLFEAQSTNCRFAMDTPTALILLLFTSFVRSQDITGKCVTPNSLMGECKEISSCDYVLSMIKKRLTSETINSIRKYQCGFKGNQPLVCCPDEITPTELPNVRLLRKNSCGHWFSNAIITSTAFLSEFPWMALLTYKNDKEVKFRCGGVIINERYILTAAHCITKLPRGLELDSVRLGDHNLSTDPDCEDSGGFSNCAPPAEDYYIEEIIPHPQFNNENIQNDIGLLRLNRTINFARDSTQPICLPLAPEEYPRSIIAGWGVTMEGEFSQQLLWNSARAADIGTCNDKYKTWTEIHPSTQTCIEAEYLRKGSCIADSGGPLMGIKDGRATLRGIMSFAAGVCRDGSFPRVFNLVEPYMNWILSSMKD